jgi:hypothetical protein
MREKFSKLVVVSAAVLMLGAGAYAQQTTPNTPADPSVAQRKQDQQDRIANGVQSGQLTPGETTNLESKESAINKETAADRAANGGKLTGAEKAQVNHQQNHLSNQIYQDKHNANSTHFGNSEVGQRQQNQQNRIANGIRSGQMTAGEAAKTENQQRGINQQVHADRAANGGKLTSGEKAQVNREQNRASRNIYDKKHNARTQK